MKAADASSWDADARAGVRLMAGIRAAAMRAAAGVELTLAPGWKTYWRYPGDSGVPPRFRFLHSQNVKSLKHACFGAHRFTDDSGATMATDGVIFSAAHRSAGSGKAGALRLSSTMRYAKTVRSGRRRDELVLDRTPSRSTPRLPKRCAGPKPPSPATTLRSRYAPWDRNRAATAHVSSWMSRRRETSLSSCSPGTDARMGLAVPEPTGRRRRRLHRFAFQLDGLPPGASARGRPDIPLGVGATRLRLRPSRLILRAG